MENKKNKIIIIIALHVFAIVFSLFICQFIYENNQVENFTVQELNEWEQEHLVSEKIIYELTYKFNGYDDYTISGENNYYHNGKHFVDFLEFIKN